MYINRYDKHTVYKGIQIQMAFLAFCFHQRIHRSLSIRISSRIVLFRWHFSVWFRWSVFFPLFILSTSLDAEHVFIALSLFTFEFMFENDRDIAMVFVCECVKRRKYIDSIMGFFKRNCNKKQE